MSEDERRVRRERLDALRAAGVEPFPAHVESRMPIAQLRVENDHLDEAALEAAQKTAAVCGRILAKRSFGKLSFFTLLEDGVRLQMSVKQSEVDALTFAFSNELDIGDFVRVEGVIWRTRKGELTIDARKLTLLAKALRPLPEKWHGLSDTEVRFRHRYLDLISNPESREIAVLRSRAISAVRAYLDAQDFLEVETPILQPLYGGAAARPFTTHHNTYDQKLYLRISDELYLKRLIVGGLDRVYEVGHNFRNEGVSRKHNPEFTMMECYQAYADYRDMMNLAEAMLRNVAQTVRGALQFTYQGNAIDFAGSWTRKTMRDAVLEATRVDFLAAPDLPSLQSAMRAAGIACDGEAPTWAQQVDALFSEYVEPKLIQPTFITDYPLELSPLAKRSPTDERIVERFELFIAGMEIGNAFSELNDPIDQRARFEMQRQAQAAGDEEAHPLDEEYLRALEHGMPPTGGLGVGLDRLVMVLTDAPTLREVVLYPHLRPEVAGEERTTAASHDEHEKGS